MLDLRASYRAASACAALFLAACGHSDGDALPPPEPPAIGIERVFPALTFAQPVAMLQAPNDGSRWFVVEQAGRVQVFNNAPQVAAFTTFADITNRVASGGEMGLLGMAFHPDFPAVPRVYLSYTHRDSGTLVSRISRFIVAGGSVDAGTEDMLLTIVQPEDNHNGGHIAFGPDGFLYIGIGDGGGANDQHPPIGNGQRTTTLLGKVLRIDVSPATGYLIPQQNPFSASAAMCGANGTGALPCPEIYALGFRNPWRFSFDANTLWLGDVGQGQREEVDRVALGGNYGWRCFEGTLATGLTCGPALNLLAPVAEYGRGVGASVTGGFVYRGSAIPDLFGRYVFGDFVSGRLMHIAATTEPTVGLASGYETGINIASFGRDLSGELYAVHYGGELYRIVAR